MRHVVALIVGGGINQELAPAVADIIEAAGVDIDWHRYDVLGGNDALGQLEEAATAVESVGLALKTRLLSPAANLNVALRRRLDLYAGVRGIRSLPGLPTRFPDLDLLLIRENSEGIYKGIEHEIVPGVVESMKVVTEAASERITRFAYETMRYLGREHLTFVHKANIMKRSDGLFLDTVRRIAADHPEFGYREVIVDAASMKLVLDPYQFDVLLMGNLYGDILSSIGNGLTGGISSGLGIDIGDGARIYEALHGDAADLVGQGIANPLPLLTPAVAMLHYLDEDEAADRIESAVAGVLIAGAMVTPDLGGTASTAQMTEAITRAL